MLDADSSPGTATPITTDGALQVHTFDTPSDQDWVSFVATAGVSYTIATSNLAPNADTVLSLYDTDCHGTFDECRWTSGDEHDSAIRPVGAASRRECSGIPNTPPCR